MDSIPLKNQTVCGKFFRYPFSANISEYSENLNESELFGHKKGSFTGAFTGALDNYSGLLGQTHINGVLFLDEIGELSMPLQVKLLHVLQDRIYSLVGSHEMHSFSERRVTATNANLFEKISRNEFRRDLYYRIASDVIEIPSLRMRFDGWPEEKRIFTHRILSRLFEDPSPEIIDSTLAQVLQLVPENYDWPGNLRRFEQWVRSVVLHGSKSHSVLKQIPLDESSSTNEFQDAWMSIRWTTDEMLAQYTQRAYQKLGSFEKVAQRLELDWRTVKNWTSLDKSQIQNSPLKK